MTLEYQPRIDNMTLVTGVFAIYELPEIAGLVLKGLSSGNQGLCPGPACPQYP